MPAFRRKLLALTTAAGFGALIAVVRRRAQAAAPDPEPLSAAPSDGRATTSIPVGAQAAIDEARDRLRTRAEALRREIDGDASG
ncbi:MAG: hypothetical protein HYX33_02840 [Actinobacteria bacterium]|nr:hypothetical protein [Actinomycetota bacterium]